MPPVTFAQTRRSFGARPTTGQTQGPAGMGGPPPQQQQSVDPILNAAAVQAANQAAQQSDPIPGGTMVPASSNPFIQRQQAAQSMLNAGVYNLAGSTPGFQGTGSGNLTVTSGSGQGTDTSSDNDKKSGIENLLSNTMFGQFVQGLDSTNKFFKNLAEKGVDGLETSDKIILANLIRAGGLDTINLQKYADKYDIDVAELGDRYTQAASGLAAGVNIGGPNAGKIVSYEDLIDNFLSGEPTGLGESFSTMGEDLKDLAFDPLRTTPNLVREDGSYTLEGLKNVLDKEGIAYLQANRPDLYLSAFGLPQTGAGLEQFANMSLQGLTGSDKDKKLSQMIIEARERIARDRQAQDKASGIMTASSAPVVPPVVPPTTPDVPPVVPPVVPPAGVIGADKTNPFNLAQFYASLPQYTQRGVMNPNLAQYYQNLGLFPRV